MTDRKRSKCHLYATALLCSSALIPLTAMTAHAQDAQENSDPVVDEVIVTTQRRAENILDVPYNISVVTGDEIAASITLDNAELLRSVPGASVIDQGPRNVQFNSIRIRGLNVDSSAFGDFLLGSVPTVATYVNETPVFANLALIDLEKVEVQRGPQATLYGSGALGGTVKYFTKKPQFGETEAILMGTASTVKGSESIGYTTGGIVNIPVSDTFALRANILWQDFPGITDYTNLYVLDQSGAPARPNGLFDLGFDSATYRAEEDADTYQSLYARLSARWQPSDNFELLANFFIQEDESGGRRQPTSGANGEGQAYGDDDNGAVILEPADRNFAMGSVEANLDLGFATLTSASSYYENEGSSETDNTGFFANNLAQFYYSTFYVFPRPLYTADRTFTDEAFTQELRIASNGGSDLDYVLGAFYQNQTRAASQASNLVGFKEWADGFFFAGPSFVIGDNVFTFERSEDYEEVAIFGEVTYALTDQLKVTGGARYFTNESTTDTFVRAGLYSFFNGSAQTDFTAKDDDVLFRLNAAYEFSDDDLFYATVSEGYRRGGSNGVPTIGQFANNPDWLTFESDKATNYELGVKGTLNGLRYDLTGFVVDWDNAQFNTSTPNGFFFAVANANGAQTKGIEFQLSGSAMDDRLNYGFGYAYVDAKLTEDFIAPPAFGSTVGTLVAADGAPLPGVADHSLNFAADYTVPLGSKYSFVTRFDAFYQSSTQNLLDANVLNATEFDGYGIMDMTFTLVGSNWDASLFVKNLANEEGTTGSFTEDAFGPEPTAEFFGSNARRFIALPRTVGAALNVKF